MSHVLDNLVAENILLRRTALAAEVSIRVAASLMRASGNVAEAQQFEREAAHIKTVRIIVSRDLRS